MLQDILQKSESPNVAAIPLDRARLPRALGCFYERLFAADRTTSSVQSVTSDVLQRITTAQASERAAILGSFLSEQVARVLALSSASRVRSDQSIMDIGMDSLTAMELRNRMQGALKIKLGVADLLRGPTIEELTVDVLRLLGIADSAPATNGEHPVAVTTDPGAKAEEAFEF
jgi:aryl carrier-like protein